MPSQIALTYLDYSNEKGFVSLNIPLVSAANLAATTSAINALVAAADDIVGGTLNKRTLTIPSAGSATLPSDEEAQREEKWLVGYTDTLANLAVGTTNPYFGKKFTVEIATAELTGHLQVNSDFADLAETDVAAFVTAFEAFARSPSGGTVNVNYIRYVGRNN